MAMSFPGSGRFCPEVGVKGVRSGMNFPLFRDCGTAPRKGYFVDAGGGCASVD
jgi:hypothetical protein